jgi:hypothetical protein
MWLSPCLHFCVNHVVKEAFMIFICIFNFKLEGDMGIARCLKMLGNDLRKIDYIDMMHLTHF